MQRNSALKLAIDAMTNDFARITIPTRWEACYGYLIGKNISHYMRGNLTRESLSKSANEVFEPLVLGLKEEGYSAAINVGRIFMGVGDIEVFLTVGDAPVSPENTDRIQTILQQKMQEIKRDNPRFLNRADRVPSAPYSRMFTSSVTEEKNGSQRSCVSLCARICKMLGM